MGRQVRKIQPWHGLAYSHLLHNHYVHRMYRWTCYMAHPNNVFGKPFKGRNGKRVTPGVLLTPDILKFHVPIPFSFVPVDQAKTVNKHTGKFPEPPRKQSGQLLSAGQYQLNNECQTQVLNYNKCIKNVGGSACNFYSQYLNRVCLNK